MTPFPNAAATLREPAATVARMFYARRDTMPPDGDGPARVREPRRPLAPLAPAALALA